MTADMIIVGQGLAGSILSYCLIRKGCQVRIFDDGENNSSAVAAGLFNPITGKRLAKTWMADEIFPHLHEFYRSLELNLGKKFYYPMPLYRPFGSLRELNEWSSKSHEELENLFVDKIIMGQVMPGIIRDTFGGMYIKGAGYVDVKTMLSALGNFFDRERSLIRERFVESRVHLSDGKVEYEGITARYLIYCSGLSAAGSRFFSWLPFRPVKGEILLAEPGTMPDFIISRGIFIIPENGNLCKVGATYDRDSPYSGITQEGKKWIMDHFRMLMRTELKLIDHYSGIRPATHDRRPFIGFHPEYGQVGLFNGFGSKGVSLVPYFAEKFIAHINDGADMANESKIIRFFN